METQQATNRRVGRGETEIEAKKSSKNQSETIRRLSKERKRRLLL